MKNSGVTLIELLIVITIATVLMVALGFAFTGWQAKYKVESQIKDIYSDLMEARVRAMQINRVHFVTLTVNQYTIQEDIAPWPDGDGDLTAADDVRPAGYNDPIPLLQKDLNPVYPIIWNGADQIDFSTRGLSNNNKTVCIFTDFDNDGTSDSNPDYDCIVISRTRINMGKLNSQVAGDCDADHCDAK